MERKGICCLVLVFLFIGRMGFSDDAPTKEEFVGLLTAAELRLESISARTRFFGTRLPEDVPEQKSIVIFVPERRQLWFDHTVNCPNNSNDGSYIVFRTLYFQNGTDFQLMGIRENVGWFGKVPTGRAKRSFLMDEKGPMVWDLLGWKMNGCVHTPIHKLLTDSDYLDDSDRPRIENISRESDNILKVEFGTKSGAYYYYTIWFDINRSVRPVRIEVHHEATGTLTLIYNDFQLEEIEPGIWFPVKAHRTTQFIDVAYDESVTKEALDAMSREQRWEFFKKGEPTEVYEHDFLIDQIKLNKSYSEETFKTDFPKTMEVHHYEPVPKRKGYQNRQAH